MGSGRLILWIKPVRHAGAEEGKPRQVPPCAYQPDRLIMQSLRAEEGTAAPALEFTIITVAITVETIGALPKEFDLDKALWTIPAARMKSKR